MFWLDGHCDTLSKGWPLEKNQGQFDFERAAARGPGAQLMAAYGADKPAQLDRLLADMGDAPPHFTPIPAVEGGDDILSPGDLDAYLSRGVRSFGLTWNRDNALGGGCMGTGSGLTTLGAAVVGRLGEAGVVVDLSHCSRACFYDALDAATGPVAVTHACCAALCRHPRNLDDDQLRALSKKGGVLGIAFHAPFLNGNNQAALEDVADHMRHALRVMGVEHVGTGSDFDGDIQAPKGLQGVEDIPALFRRLTLPERAERMVAGGNFGRLLGL